jgi:sec-independent protein translocase protein TatB
VDVFDVSPAEILTLAFIALLVFGPQRLPEMAAKAGRFVRQLRAMAESARADLGEQLGPEFKDLQLSDLQPRNLVRKHLLDGIDDDGSLRRATDLRQLGREITGMGAVGGAAGARSRTTADAANGTSRNGSDGDNSALPAAMRATEADAPAPFDIDAT